MNSACRHYSFGSMAEVEANVPFVYHVLYGESRSYSSLLFLEFLHLLTLLLIWLLPR
jgi:hypothetical protein